MFFKLIAQERIGNQTRKQYDTAKVPYQGVLERKDIPLAAKTQILHSSLKLNPTQLRRRMDQKIAKLWKISREHFLLLHYANKLDMPIDHLQVFSFDNGFISRKVFLHLRLLSD